MNKKFRSIKCNRIMVAAGLTAAAGVASAAVDIAPVTASLTDIAAVGTAVFAVYVAIKLTKWVRRAL